MPTNFSSEKLKVYEETYIIFTLLTILWYATFTLKILLEQQTPIFSV